MYHQLDVPTLSNFDTVRCALDEYYIPYLKISGISEGSFSSFDQNFGLETCDVDMTVVNKLRQDIHDDWVILDNVDSEYIEQDHKHNSSDDVQIQIQLEQLFNLRNIEPNGNERAPRRILIHGRAGIGKSTLCKKMVYLHQKKGMWENEFESVLWMPLRQLK
ncbi:hypothetical protein BGZ76_007755, partial [Entomortierella beljakovae]